MKDQKIIYYQDELNDEFSKAKIVPRKIDKNYKYLHNNIFWKISHFFWYRCIAHPLGFIYCKLKFKHKIVGREKLKNIKTGYFLYGNHTQEMADAFIPSLITGAKDNYVIVHPSNVSMKILGRITPRMGAMPLPDDLGGFKNFMHAVETRIKQKCCVTIYPEAHIWPYYTKIRNFPSTSFKYPIKLDVPAFCFTNTYQKRKNSKKVKIITYIDGPFFADRNLSPKEQETDLRNKIFEAMTERSKNSNVEIIKYALKEKNND